MHSAMKILVANITSLICSSYFRLQSTSDAAWHSYGWWRKFGYRGTESSVAQSPSANEPGSNLPTKSTSVLNFQCNVQYIRDNAYACILRVHWSEKLPKRHNPSKIPNFQDKTFSRFLQVIPHCFATFFAERKWRKRKMTMEKHTHTADRGDEKRKVVFDPRQYAYNINTRLVGSR
jgi:hypothetical protein